MWLMDSGMPVPVVLPLLTIGILLLWHRGRGDRWEIRHETLAAMGAESCFLAVLLAACGHLMRTFVPAAIGAPEAASDATGQLSGGRTLRGDALPPDGDSGAVSAAPESADSVPSGLGG